MNPKINDEKIDQYKQNYEPFSWALGVAPADDPEIAVVAMIPQGKTGGNAMLLVREVMGNYFGIGENKSNSNANNNADNVEKNLNELKKEDINFVPKMKK